MILRRPLCKSDSLVIVGVFLRLWVRVCGQLRSPPIGESAVMKIMSGVFCSLNHSAGPRVCLIVMGYASV